MSSDIGPSRPEQDSASLPIAQRLSFAPSPHLAGVAQAFVNRSRFAPELAGPRGTGQEEWRFLRVSWSVVAQPSGAWRDWPPTRVVRPRPCVAVAVRTASTHGTETHPGGP